MIEEVYSMEETTFVSVNLAKTAKKVYGRKPNSFKDCKKEAKVDESFQETSHISVSSLSCSSKNEEVNTNTVTKDLDPLAIRELGQDISLVSDEKKCTKVILGNAEKCDKEAIENGEIISLKGSKDLETEDGEADDHKKNEKDCVERGYLEGSAVLDRKRRGRRFPVGVRQEVVAALGTESETAVSLKWGVSVSTARRWARQEGVARLVKLQGYTQEVRQEVLACYRTKGLAAACRSFGVDKNTVYKWAGGSQGGPRVHSAETKAAAVLCYREQGLGQACRQFQVVHRTLLRWAAELGQDWQEALPKEEDDVPHSAKSKRRWFSETFKQQVLAAYVKSGAAAAARQFGVSKRRVWEWRKAMGSSKYLDNHLVGEAIKQMPKKRRSTYAAETKSTALAHYRYLILYLSTNTTQTKA